MSEQGLDGQMTEEMYTEYVHRRDSLIRLSAKISAELIWLDGLVNSLRRLETLEADSEPSSIRELALLTLQNNMRRCHSGCSCNCSEKPDTSDDRMDD